jgi:hypothetical protein
MPNRTTPIDAPELRARAERFRSKAAYLLEIGKQAPEGSIKETYTALVIEYDFLAREVERIATEIAGRR